MADQNNNQNNIIIDYRDQFLLPLGRVQWEDLFTARQYKDGKPKYSVQLFFPADADFSGYHAAVARLKANPEVKKYLVTPGSDKEQKLIAAGVTKDEIVYEDAFMKSLIKPIKKEKDLEKLERNPYLAGQLIAKASTSLPPVVIDCAKRPITKDNKDQVYRGCYGHALVSVGMYGGGKGLSLCLHGFQKTRNGEPLFTSSTNVDLFESFTDDSSLAENDGI